MNRWRKIEEAKGKRPQFSMVDHYSHARDLMPVTWRYSFVQYLRQCSQAIWGFHTITQTVTRLGIQHVESTGWGILFQWNTRMGRLVGNGRWRTRVLRRLVLHPKPNALMVTRCVWGSTRVLGLALLIRPWNACHCSSQRNKLSPLSCALKAGRMRVWTNSPHSLFRIVFLIQIYGQSIDWFDVLSECRFSDKLEPLKDKIGIWQN